MNSTKMQKASPTTDMSLHNCTNVTIENHMPSNLRINKEVTGKDFKDLYLLVSLVQSSLKKHTKAQLKLLNDALTEMKVTDDKQLNKMQNNVQLHFKDFQRILENFDTKTGTVELPDEEMKKMATLPSVVTVDNSNKENVNPETAKMESKFQQTEHWFRKLDPKVLTQILETFESTNNWIMEQVCENIMDLSRLRRVCLHIVNYEKSCGDSDCPTCHGEDIGIFELDNGRLVFKDGIDFIQKAIQDTKERHVANEVNVMRFITEVYPNVLETFGVQDINARVVEQLTQKQSHDKNKKYNFRARSTSAKSTNRIRFAHKHKKHNLRSRSVDSSKKCKFC